MSHRERFEEIEQLRYQVSDLQLRNSQASDDLVAASERILTLEARLRRQTEAPKCRHLEGCPTGTQVCYLYRGAIRIMGEPGNDHSCDAMGCGSVGDHVVKIVPVPA
jgi:hypothetical protein